MSRIERDKAILDLMKHTGTVAGASLTFIAAFVTDGTNIDSRFVKGAVVCLVLSLVANLAAYYISLFAFFGRGPERSEEKNRGWAVRFAISAAATATLMIAGFIVLGIGVYLSP